MASPVARAVKVPITFEGRAVFNLQNALAAAAVTHALDLKIEEIRQGLVSFFPSPSQTPGRTNFFNIRDFEVMLDYAHNPSAYRQVLDLIARLGHPRRIFVFDVVGGRRDEDIREVCHLIAGHCDHAVVFEDKDLQGRKPGERIALAAASLAAVGLPAAVIDKIPNESDAIDHALAMARKGDLVCIMSGRVEQVIQQLYACKEDAAAASGAEGH
jgi:cyanophycin synthetase